MTDSTENAAVDTPETDQIQKLNSLIQIQIITLSQNLDLNSYYEIPSNLSFSIWWISGM